MKKIIAGSIMIIFMFGSVVWAGQIKMGDLVMNPLNVDHKIGGLFYMGFPTEEGYSTSVDVWTVDFKGDLEDYEESMRRYMKENKLHMIFAKMSEDNALILHYIGSEKSKKTGEMLNVRFYAKIVYINKQTKYVARASATFKEWGQHGANLIQSVNSMKKPISN